MYTEVELGFKIAFSWLSQA